MKDILKKNNLGFSKQHTSSKKQKSGYTLVELIVVLFIISLILSIFLVDYKKGGRELSLQRAVQKLAQDIRKAQEYALASKEIGPSGSEMVPEGGYGIHLEESETNSYIFFADCDNNQSYTPGNSVCGFSPNNFPEKIKEIKLESGVEIKNISPLSNLDITFVPPDPTIHISGGDTAVITITLTSDPTKTKTIIINKAGLIEIQ